MSLAELQAIEACGSPPTRASPSSSCAARARACGTRRATSTSTSSCGISVTNVGHCHPRVVAGRARAGRAAAARLQPLLHRARHAPGAAPLAVEPRRQGLSSATPAPRPTRPRIKLARKARPGGDIVVVHGAFHGRTYGALSATPQESKQAPFAPLVPGFRAVAPEPDALRAAIDERTAAVLLEPIQGETGVNVLCDELLHAARAACDEHGAALIFDEIQCGMGRTGTLWAYEQTGVVPDALTAAKALGGGLPIGALVTGERLADVFAPGDHGSTFAGGPVVCAAALAALELIDEPALLGACTRARRAPRRGPGASCRTCSPCAGAG